MQTGQTTGFAPPSHPTPCTLSLCNPEYFDGRTRILRTRDAHAHQAVMSTPVPGEQRSYEKTEIYTGLDAKPPMDHRIFQQEECRFQINILTNNLFFFSKYLLPT